MSPQIFVCGATGTQGGATARHLRAADVTVHALVRDTSSPKAQALEALGVKLFPGNYDDAESLKAALAGCTGIFLNFSPSFTDFTQETRHAKTVIAAAKEAGVKHAAYASVLGHDELPELLASSGLVVATAFIQSKHDNFNAVVEAGFDTWTRLQPGKFMGDFIAPGVPMFPDLGGSGIWESGIRAEDEIRLVDPDDIGIVSAAALLDPEKYNGQKVDIFSQIVNPVELVKTLAKVSGKKIGIEFLPEEELNARIATNVYLLGQRLTRYSGLGIPLETAKKWGSKCQTFENFLLREKATVDSTFANVPSA